MADRAMKSLKAAPPKGKKKPKTTAASEEREETLQAVILADSHETRFAPFTLERPRCLLPLVNTPLIEYTLEFLAMSGVQEVFIYAGAHTQQVEDYIRASRWWPGNSKSPFSSLDIIINEARSIGDALRDLDNRGLITGDFLLVHGDLVANFPIDAALQRHRDRRMKDKNAIMTVVLREGGMDEHRTMSHGITPVFVTNPTKQRILHYEEMGMMHAHRYINMNPELVDENQEMEIRTDLIDCGIDICTPDVLALWSDNFDFEVPRRHFLHGVLKDYELNGKTFHTEILSQYYAARVSNLQAYAAISKDVVARWTYPLVPDNNLVDGQSYVRSECGLSKESDVILAKNCELLYDNIIGKNTSIGDGSTIHNSIIGRNCIIGKNVRIEDSFIWDNVTISDSVAVSGSVIADEVFIGKNSILHPMTLLSFGVCLDEKPALKPGMRITRALRRYPEDEDAPENRKPTEHQWVGLKGDGFAYTDFNDPREQGDHPTEESYQSDLYYKLYQNFRNESTSTLTSDISGDDHDDRDAHDPRHRTESFMSSASDDASEAGTGEAFHKDAVADVFKTLRENGDFANTRVEFTSLRLSNNASDHQMRRAVAAAFMKRIVQLIENGAEIASAVSTAFGQEGAVEFIQSQAVGTEKVLEDQVDFLLCVQKDLSHRDKGEVILFVCCKALYEHDLIEEEAFEAWWADGKGVETEEMRNVRIKAADFIEWLQEAEEESGEESEEGEEEEEESDEE